MFVVSLLLATLLWFSDKLSEILEPYLVLLNSLPKSALAPLFIVWLGTGINTIIIAGISVAVFGSIISFSPGGSGKGDSDPHFGGKPQRYLFQSRPPGICSHTAQHHQGQYRSVFSRCHHRRISGSQTRAGLSHHLRFPGVPAGYGDQFYLTVMCHCHAALSADPVSGTLQQKASQLIIMFSSEICRMASSSYSLLHNLQFCETNF